MNHVRKLEEKNEMLMQLSLKALNVDFIVDSPYGEEKLPAIISRLKDGLPFHDIPNLYVREEDRFYRTEKKDEEYILQEKKINWPLFKGRSGDTIAIRTSVSCYNRCKFCTFPGIGGRYNNVDIAFLEQELDGIQRLGGVEFVTFLDDTFNIPPNRFKEVLKMMIRNKYTFKWYGMIRCQQLDEEAIKLMKDSGCIGAFLGIESGSDKMLKSMNKQATVEQYRKGIKLLKDYEITTLASFFIGFPEETKETAEETYRFIEETKPDFYLLHMWIYETHAPVHAQREQYGLKGNLLKWSHKDMDSETAFQIVEEIRQRVKNSIWVDSICNTLLFQMLVKMDLPTVTKVCRNTFSEPLGVSWMR